MMMYRGALLLLLCGGILPNNNRVDGFEIVREPSLEELKIMVGLEEPRSYRSIQPRIVGGVDAPQGRFPWFALLEIFVDGDADPFECGASLIWEDLLLTTAHCVQDLEVLDGLTVTGINALINLHDFDNRTGVEARQVEIAIPHPMNNVDTHENDIMLLKLASPVLNIQPVMLNFDSTIPADFQRVDTMGFGALAEDDQADFASILQVVDVAAIPFDDCNDANSYNGTVFDPIMICAGEPNNLGGKDSCFGDSGGPLYVLGDGPTTDVVVGLNSKGVGCARPDFPGVYTRVSAYAGFIVNQICNFSNNPPEETCAAIPSPNTGPVQAPTTAPPTPVPTPFPTITITARPTFSFTASPFLFVGDDDDDDDDDGDDDDDDTGKGGSKSGGDDDDDDDGGFAPFVIAPISSPTMQPFSIPTSSGSMGMGKGGKKGSKSSKRGRRDRRLDYSNRGR